MHRRTARTVQRLALVGGLCAGAWCAAEGLDHGTAWADDVPVRVENVAPVQGSGNSWGASDPPGAGATTPVRDLVDDILDEVLPEPARPDDDQPQPPPQTEPADDEPAEQPVPPTPIRDVVDDILEILPVPTTPQTPEPAAGDGSSPQHPADTPPAPVPTPTPTPTVPPTDTEPEVPAEVLIPGLPGTPEVAEPPVSLFVGYHQPAPYVPAHDVQTVRGGPVCDGRGATPAAPRPDTRGQPEFPRAPAGPGHTPPANPCDPDGDGHLYETPIAPASYSGDHALVGPAAITRVWVLDLHRDDLGHDRHDDALPVGRLTLWPPGPG